MIIGSWIVGGEGSTSEDKEKVETVDKQVEAEKKEKDDKKEEKTKKEEKKKAEEERKSNRTVDEAIEEDNDNVDKATLKDGTLTLVGEGKTTFSENTLFMSVYDMFEAMHEGFKDENVKEVYIELTTTMVDQKGNESVEPVIKYNYSRESFEELNYDNFSDMAYSEEWRILTEADYYYIHPGIYKNLKDKYTDHVNVEGFK
ncbi:hypothetical protein [Pseudogracilibacillus sp. SO30301A]|uniref:hypothetical protein n=1 Tax=Pseudogracilibacillus sp. SO30301A TaxID=3098291 RepID=UPI00300E0C0C